MKKLFITLSILLGIFLVLQVQPVFGQGAGEGEVKAPKFYQDAGTKVLPTLTPAVVPVARTSDVLDITIVGIINQVSNVFIGFSVLFIIVAGIQYVLAQGDEEKIKKAHKSILWSVLGIILVMLSYTIVYIVNTLFQ